MSYVRVENASKIFCRSVKKSMLYGLMDIAAEATGIGNRDKNLRPFEFYALENISLELSKGDCLGLIGANGSGKSTLLKMINGIYMPDTGMIEIHGNVGALIEVGAGFHPMLTGRENIFLNGSILGMKKAEISKNLEAIVEYAELKDFIDMPVKYYSSGMYVRLGVAIAAQIKPDVLIIDEVLSVGDIGFRAKCVNSILDIMQDTATIFVSHNMTDIARICNRIICLDDGKIIYSGENVQQGILKYYEQADIEGNNKFDSESAGINSIEIKQNNDHGENNIFTYGSEIEIYVKGYVLSQLRDMTISLNIFDIGMQMVEQNSSYFNNYPIMISDGQFSVSLKIDQILLNPGKYYLSVVVHDREHHKVLAKDHCNINFMITGKHFGNAVRLGNYHWQNHI